MSSRQALRAGRPCDISLRFFDAGGSQVASPLDGRGAGIRLEQLEAANLCVAVAGWISKAEAIHAALHGG
jgi:DNA-binding transcriptional regulator LsrR (DeoR family)